jgi:hypothetical protein
VFLGVDTTATLAMRFILRVLMEESAKMEKVNLREKLGLGYRYTRRRVVKHEDLEFCAHCSEIVLRDWKGWLAPNLAYDPEEAV